MYVVERERRYLEAKVFSSSGGLVFSSSGGFVWRVRSRASA